MFTLLCYKKKGRKKKNEGGFRNGKIIGEKFNFKVSSNSQQRSE
jgi:hypothetical protein